jgi:hypothetical protein
MSGDWERELVRGLLADATLSSLVGESIEWDVRAQGEDLPAITLYLISDARPRHMKGEIGFRESRVQADCYAADGVMVRSVREVLIRAMEALSHTVRGSSPDQVRFNRIAVDGTGSGTDRSNAESVHRQRVDFLIWHD